MDLKKTNAAPTTITRNLRDIDAKTGNLYQSVSILSKRANQLSLEIKGELTKKLSEFSSHIDNLEEVFENREQIEVSKHYERLPKPAALAIQEFTEDKVYFRKPEETQAQ